MESKGPVENGVHPDTRMEGSSVVSTGSPRRYGDKGFSIGPFDYHVQDATLIVLDIGRGPPPYGGLSSSPSVGRGGPFEDPFIRRMRFLRRGLFRGGDRRVREREPARSRLEKFVEIKIRHSLNFDGILTQPCALTP
jgi:hypothetical protein